MNFKTAGLLIACHRQGMPPSDPRILKAVELAEADSELSAALARQTQFDRHVLDLISKLQVPDSLASEEEPDSAGKRHPVCWLALLKNPVFLAGVVGALLILGVVLFFSLRNISNFPGQEALEEMLESTGAMTGVELEPVQTEVGKLGDWFFLKYQIEHCDVPQEFSAWKTVGCRLFKKDGHSVAQIAVEKNNSLLFVFKADDFGVQLPAQTGKWHILQQEGWTAAVRRDGETCFMLAFMGTRPQMEKLLSQPTP